MIPAIILAAGASRRMGRPKALLPIAGEGEVFVTRLLHTLATGGADDLVVVVGAEAEAVSERLARCPVTARVVENRGYDRGQLSSLLAGLAVVDRPGTRAVMVMPVDMPLVQPATVSAVRAGYLHRGALVVRPARGQRHGHPVVFDRRLFDELRAADPSIGARAVVAAHRAEVLDLELPADDPGAFVDIDTPADYERCFGVSLRDLRV